MYTIWNLTKQSRCQKKTVSLEIPTCHAFLLIICNRLPAHFLTSLKCIPVHSHYHPQLIIIIEWTSWAKHPHLFLLLLNKSFVFSSHLSPSIPQPKTLRHHRYNTCLPIFVIFAKKNDRVKYMRFFLQSAWTCISKTRYNVNTSVSERFIIGTSTRRLEWMTESTSYILWQTLYLVASTNRPLVDDDDERGLGRDCS